jgi:hypothetical protein
VSLSSALIQPRNNSLDAFIQVLETQPNSIGCVVKFNEAPAEFWDTFYATRKDTFFKDRAWLRNEFPILEQAVTPDVCHLPKLFLFKNK